MSKEHPAITEPIPGGMGASRIGQEEIDAVTELLRHPDHLFRYREGGHSSALEREACELTGMAHALFVNSGTSALICALSAWEVGPGDEVIVPAYTYIATASAVLAVGAVPVIAEIDESLGLDPEDVRKKITPYTRAIIMVHMQGIPGRLAEIQAIAREKGLVMIEDCCQAIGSRYRGAFTGVRSDAAAWSLNYFKNITCGEGGMFFTNDREAFIRGVYQADPGTPMWDSEFSENLTVPVFSRGGYRGNEINAVIARVQLKRLEGMLSQSRAIKARVLQGLNTPRHYRLQHVDDPEGECGISLALIANSVEEAKQLTQGLKDEGLFTNAAYGTGFPDRHIYTYWEAVLNKNGPTPKGYPWKDPSYKGNVQYSRDMCPKTLDILSRSLRIGLSCNMQERHADMVAAAINAADAAF